MTIKQTHVFGLCPCCKDTHSIHRSTPLEQTILCGWCGHAAPAIDYVVLGRAERQRLRLPTSQLDAE